MKGITERIDFLSGDVEVIEAIAFTRNNASYLTKQPHAVLRVKETILTIEDKTIMWSFLDMLDTKEKFPFLNYLAVVDEVPLLRVIEDFLHDYPNTMFHAWIDKGVIVGFDGKEHNPAATSDTMIEIESYIKSKDENYNGNICLRPNLHYDSSTRQMGLTAEYISGNKIIEITSVGRIAQIIYISGRYAVGSDFYQPLPTRVFKGALFSMPVKELYETIDLFFEELKLMEDRNMPEIDSHSEAYRMTLTSRNRIEFERFSVMGDGN